MNKYRAVNTKIVVFDDKNNVLPDELAAELEIFFNKKGIHPQTTETPGLTDPNIAGELAVFYTDDHRISGFIRIAREPLNINHKAYTLSTATIHIDESAELKHDITRFFLTQSMKYKLNHPEEDLVHVALINEPQTYQWVNTLYSQLYPKPKTQTPEQVLKLTQQLKTVKNWSSSDHHPMVVNTLTSLQPREQLAGHSDDLSEFYQSVNPDHEKGDALLTYIPLSLTNLCYGIKRLVA